MTSTKDLIITNREKVREQWGKSASDVEEYISILKQWFGTQKHLPEIPDDNTLELFLTNCKYSIEKAKQALDMYYTVRTLIPEYFNISHPRNPEVQLAPKMATMICLPQLTDTLYRVSIFKFTEGGSEIYDHNVVSASQSNIFEVRLHEDLTMGEIIIVDATHVTMMHVLKFNPTVIKRCTLLLEKVMSNRVKAIHIIHYPPFIDKAVAVTKVFMKEKITERLFFHPNLESLYEHVPRKMLPSDYGGQEKSCQTLLDLWNLKIKEYEERFDKLDQMKVNESLRPQALSNSEVLGYYGNFKKLDVD